MLSFILSSYDPPFVHLEGVIVDKSTLTPIDSALINLRERASLYSDSVGTFKIDQMRSGILGIFVEKKGYQPRYIEFSTDKYDLGNVVIELQATTKEYKPLFSQNKLRFINTLIKIVFSLFNAVTLIFILLQSKRIRKFLWITGIMLINPVFRLLFLDFSLLEYDIVNGPFYIFNYWNLPYSMIVPVPLTAISFWILYLVRNGRDEQKNQVPEVVLV